MAVTGGYMAVARTGDTAVALASGPLQWHVTHATRTGGARDARLGRGGGGLAARTADARQDKAGRVARAASVGLTRR